jgi:hypothetical protein
VEGVQVVGVIPRPAVDLIVKTKRIFVFALALDVRWSELQLTDFHPLPHTFLVIPRCNLLGQTIWRLFIGEHLKEPQRPNLLKFLTLRPLISVNELVLIRP